MAKDTKKSKDQIKDLTTKLLAKESELENFKKDVAKLNKNIEVLVSKIHDQIKVAQKIQATLLPTEIPNIPGFEFSTKFVPSIHSGGDYFDIFELEDRFRFGILMASSSGHGISALFLSILLKLTGQIEARRGTPPDKVVKMIFKEIESQIKEKEYANIFYSILDRRNFELQFCNKGSNLAFLYKFSEKEVVQLARPSDPLKKNMDPTFKIETESLNPRDCLVVVSEGVIQTQSPANEAFGTKRLENIIYDKAQTSPHEIRNEVLYQLQEFRASKELKKDATVIVAEVKDRVLKLAK